MTPDALLAWRRSQGFSQADAARSLGLSLRGWQNYESGVREPPKSLQLAIMRGVVLANLATRLEAKGPLNRLQTAQEIRNLLDSEFPSNV